MRCTSVLRRIDDHADGLLPAQEAEQVRDHLDHCGECRETAVAAKAASTSLAAWGDLDPPAQCLDAIWEKIDALPPDALSRSARARPRPAPWGRLLRLAVPAAAAAVVVAGFVATGRLRPSATMSRSARPAAVASVAATAASFPSAARTGVLAAPAGLRQGEEYIHLDTEFDAGVRRNGPGVPILTVGDFRFRPLR
jgi:subtilisin family serine protease